MFEIYNEDCFDTLKKIKDDSVDLVFTDPPYFIDKMGSDWCSQNIKRGQEKSGVVGGMPVGMKFDKKQSKKFFEFQKKCFNEYERVVKPGGFVISFSQARLYHCLAMAAELSGFEIRDMLGWCYEGQAKAFSQDHFIKNNKKMSDKEKTDTLIKLDGRKTPQLKPMIEPMVLAQKERIGTFVENFMKYNVGLIDTSVSVNEKFPGNIFDYPKPSRDERKNSNNHPTVKPLILIEKIIEIFTVNGGVVVDPFLGSGTTAVACQNTGRDFIGCELDKGYFETIKKRLKNT